MSMSIAQWPARLHRLIFTFGAFVIALSRTHEASFIGANAFRDAMMTKKRRTPISLIEHNGCKTIHNGPCSSSSEPALSLLFSSSSSPEEDNDDEESRVDIGNSLEILALSVALFFVASVAFVGGDKLFATPPLSTSFGSPRVIIDPDAVLREDFEKSSTAVLF